MQNLPDEEEDANKNIRNFHATYVVRNPASQILPEHYLEFSIKTLGSSSSKSNSSNSSDTSSDKS